MDTVWRLDTGGAKDSKDAVKSMVGSNSTTWGDITKESKEMQIEALKEAYEELKEMYGEENIISAVIHVDGTTPPSALCILRR